MKKIVDAVGALVPLTIEVVDISKDQALMDRYGLEIPVLMIDGKRAAKYRVTQRELEEKLQKRRGPA